MLKLLPAGALAAAVAVCAAAAPARAADLSQTVRRGNEALAQGKFDEALENYRQAAEAEPFRPELLYNQAVAHYRKGEYKQARRLFTQATAADDRKLNARARFNLANCDYAEAIELSQKDKPAAVERLNRAISHYRGSLQANPDEVDARANIELAQLLKRQLQDQQKQDQQKQDQQKQDQQKQDQQKQDQQKQDQQKQDQQKQDQQKQDQQKRDQQKQDQQKQDQKQDQHKQDQQKQDQQKQDQQKQDQQKQDQQKQDQQKQDQQKQDQQQETSQQQTEPSAPPSGKLDAANQDEQPPTAEPPGEGEAEPQARSMTREEAEKMLQAVRDRNLMRRLQQYEQRRSRRVPVDKDW